MKEEKITYSTFCQDRNRSYIDVKLMYNWKMYKYIITYPVHYNYLEEFSESGPLLLPFSPTL